jgi:hypothetical protein
VTSVEKMQVHFRILRAASFGWFGSRTLGRGNPLPPSNRGNFP